VRDEEIDWRTSARWPVNEPSRGAHKPRFSTQVKNGTGLARAEKNAHTACSRKNESEIRAEIVFFFSSSLQRESTGRCAREPVFWRGLGTQSETWPSEPTELLRTKSGRGAIPAAEPSSRKKKTKLVVG
jgi:hypothetical protein